ncbi:MAG: response regulator [Pseudomonadota bacterium]
MAERTILVVDDEEYNLEILTEYLEDANYEVVAVERGEEAWSLLQDDPQRFHAVLLDRMMPGMDGLEVLEHVRQEPKLDGLPIIMQTAKGSEKDVVEGFRAGAHYYLIKPFERDRLMAIVKTAVTDFERYRHLREESRQMTDCLTLMNEAVFTFSTLEDARQLAAMLSKACPQSDRVVVGLVELFFNAVEHGNLGITYDEKSNLITEGNWMEEVERRRQLPDNIDKVVQVEFSRGQNEICFTVKDQGKGFDWRKYLEVAPERIFDTHGRGIAMARMIGFDSLDYQDKGNVVVATSLLETTPESTV